MPPTDTSVELTKAIISALPAAALAVLFAVFAVIVVFIFIRFLAAEGERNRDDRREQSQRWRDDMTSQNLLWRTQFGEAMSRFAGEMGQVNQNVQAMASSLGNHDRTTQIGIAGLTNAIQVVSKTAAGPLAEPAPRKGA